MLSSPALVGTGLISYFLYIRQYPLLLFWKTSLGFKSYLNSFVALLSTFGAASMGGGEGGVQCRNVVAASGVYRNRSGDAALGGLVLLQQARNRGTMDQRRQAGSQGDPTSL
jgi:hypothetical protein